jgi:2-polyprenyl-3-methyl-5-hydroxy-6-metoxy-1,4-benzoquinol methylase|tara:strand:- start:2291 stop:2983 length:693 start_codon:yes stop_codon:yes gene_type:complete
MKENSIWDRGRWSFTGEVSFDFMTKYIYEQLTNCVSFKDKTILEFGSGLGRLSYLALMDKAKEVTLVDSSSKAILLSNELFKTEKKNSYYIIHSDIYKFDSKKKYDIVFSSGLIEHFFRSERSYIIRKHIKSAKFDCIFVHPTDNFYNTIINRFPLSVMLYGFQKSYSIEEINGYLRPLVSLKHVSHNTFHLFYTVPFLHNNEKLNRLVDKNIFSRVRKGLTITHIKLKK